MVSNSGNIMQILKTVLKAKPGFISGSGELNRRILLTKATNFDSELITLLLENDVLKQKFFTPILDALVFDLNSFIFFLESKDYLHNSYTRFANKIGLNIQGRYINQINEIALVWPYKDSVLEGGQSKKKQKKNEIFFNEILAQNEITQLLEPKVLTSAWRYDENGKKKLSHFKRDKQLNIKRNLPADTITDNLIIRGNNLMALHSIKSQFANKIKLIYIDPPYNTGNDSFNYNDKFNHSTWLTFMKNRLEIAKELLHKDGAIFVQCDDKEQAYLKVMMDEIYGRENHRETIVVKTSTPSGVNAINVKRGERLFKVKEYILFYSKNSGYRFNPIYVKSKFNKNYRYEVIKTGEGYKIKDLKYIFKNPQELENYALKNYQNIYSLEKNNKKAGAKIKAVIEQSKNHNEVIEYLNSHNQKVLIYNGGVFIPLKDRIVKDNKKNYFGTLISDLWDDEIFQSNKTEGGVNLPGGKKPEKLLKRILELTTTKDDIVLDYFLGSGTTAAVAHKMNRQYIGIEQLDYGENDSTVRLTNVINGDKTGISPMVNWQRGGEFVYFELKKSNQLLIDKILQATTKKELLSLWQTINKSAFIKYFIDLDLQNKNIEDFNKLNTTEQKKYLIYILDKNQLYVNLSSIDDKDFEVTQEEKKITDSFYNYLNKR